MALAASIRCFRSVYLWFITAFRKLNGSVQTIGVFGLSSKSPAYDRLVLATRSALAADGHLLSAPERARIDEAIAALEKAAREFTEAAPVEAASEALAKATEGFAAERMNHSIQQALAGRNVETL